ncbi:hypothetical protein P9112_009068 [Eukaryota sp. TZLM1-RC]
MSPGPTDPFQCPSRTDTIFCKYFEWKPPKRTVIQVQNWIWNRQIAIRKELEVRQHEEKAASSKKLAEQRAMYKEKIGKLESELGTLDNTKKQYFSLLKHVIRTEEAEKQKREQEENEQRKSTPSPTEQDQKDIKPATQQRNYLNPRNQHRPNLAPAKPSNKEFFSRPAPPIEHGAVGKQSKPPGFNGYRGRGGFRGRGGYRGRGRFSRGPSKPFIQNAFTSQHFQQKTMGNRPSWGQRG